MQGTARRKKKVVHRAAATDDKKLQASLKKLGMSAIPGAALRPPRPAARTAAAHGVAGVEEVNMIKDDGNVIHFSAPKVQASIPSNTFSISGQSETKELSEMLPGILNQLGPDSLQSLKRLAESMGGAPGGAPAGAGGDDDDSDDDVPDLVEGNFEEVAAD